MKTSFIFTGDSFITRRMPENGYDGFSELSGIIKKHDVRFNNLEMTIHDKKGYPEAVSGGTWAMAEPAVLDGLNEYGFNLYNTANNHSLDYGHGGLLGTIECLKERNLSFAGTGENLHEASKASYLETKASRVALISVCSSFSANSPASNQRLDIKGRPGLNPLHYDTIYHITTEHYRSLEEVVRVTGMNSTAMRSVRLGYAPPPAEGELKLGQLRFKLDDNNEVQTTPSQKDMNRITTHIKEALRQSDYVIVSLHAHEFRDSDETLPARFVETFARACIDEGAHAVVGHGPHELRGIEIYNGKPIFYSLGNFIFQTETVAYQPSDAYENHSMSNTTTVGEYMDNRSKNGTRGYGIQPNIWRSVMAGVCMEDGKATEIHLYPIDLRMNFPRSRKGLPVLAKNSSVIEYLAELSKPYGTEIVVKENIGVIELN